MRGRGGHGIEYRTGRIKRLVLPGWLYIEWCAVSFTERFDLNLVENKVAATSPSILIIILDGRMQIEPSGQKAVCCRRCCRESMMT